MATWGKVGGGSALPGRSVRRDNRRERDLPRPVCPALQVDIPRALGLVSGSVCVMTAAYEHKRAGVIARRVMHCADEPACVLVALPKGQRLATLIRDSHGFVLNVVDPTQRLLMKKFQPDEDGDQFDMLETRSLATGAPAILRAVAALDCEVMRHFDLEADHEVYVGQVLAAVVFAKDHACASAAASATPTGNGTAVHAHVSGVSGVMPGHDAEGLVSNGNREHHPGEARGRLVS